MKNILHTLKNFNAYQKERFPILILSISFVPAILSSSAVVGVSATLTFVGSALVASIAYLLHVRIIDEYRDFTHDVEHHDNRPLPAGRISLRELQYIDWIAVLVFLSIAGISSSNALLFALVLLAYSYLAWKEFFASGALRKRFFLYNGVNLVQMLLLQVLVYILALSTVLPHPLLIAHFFFTATGTIIFEFLRKVKIKGTDGTGKDTYTTFLSFKNALLLYSALLVINGLLFVKIVITASALPGYVSLFFGFLFSLALAAVALNWRREEQKTNQLMQLSFMLLYSACNLAIFFNI